MRKKVFSLGLMYLTSANMKGTPEFEKQQLEVWWQSLRDLGDMVFLQTCKDIVKVESWFPAIADVRKLAKHPEDPILAGAERRKVRLKIKQERKLSYG